MLRPADRDSKEFLKVFSNKIIRHYAAGCYGAFGILSSLELPSPQNVYFKVPRDRSEKSC